MLAGFTRGMPSLLDEQTLVYRGRVIRVREAELQNMLEMEHRHWEHVPTRFPLPGRGDKQQQSRQLIPVRGLCYVPDTERMLNKAYFT